jgi:hypothetical protein
VRTRCEVWFATLYSPPVCGLRLSYAPLSLEKLPQVECAIWIASLLPECVRGERSIDISLLLEKVTHCDAIDGIATPFRPKKGSEREKWVVPLD